MKKIIALGIVIFVVAIGYTIAWFWAAGQAAAYVKTLETADGVTTPRVTCGAFGIGGFPFGFDATCTEATIVSGDVTVTMTGLKASAEVYRPTHVLLFAQSPVSIDDAFTGSRSRLDFASVTASARLDGWRIGRVSVVMEAPVWNDTVLDDRLLAKADRAELHLIDIPEQHDATAGLASLAQYAEIDGLNAPGFEIAAGKSTFEAEITNLPDDVRTYGDADLLQRWQAAGGKFILTGFKGDDTPNRFEASGTLGLDSGGRLEGQIKLSSKGVVERLGSIIPEQYKGLILGGQADDGSYSQTVNIAAGVVFSGLVPAGMIPPLF
jgi:hypothetical protein